MFSKEDFLSSVTQQINICKHLHSKLNADDMDYSPGEGVRNTLELMRYLTYCGVGPMNSIINDAWDEMGARIEKASKMTADEFPAHMDDQLKEMEELLATVSDEDLLTKEVSLPWGDQSILGPVLVKTSLGFLIAYRMQLFIHAKAAGHTELSTFNCWRGSDAPPSA